MDRGWLVHAVTLRVLPNQTTSSSPQRKSAVVPLQQFTPTLAPLENVFLLAKRTRKQSNNWLLRLCCVFLNKRTKNWICRSHLWFEATCGVVFLLQLYDLGGLERQPHIWHPLDKLSWDICHMGRSDKHILMELPYVFILEREQTWLDTSPSDLSLSEAFDQPPNFFGWYSFTVDV